MFLVINVIHITKGQIIVKIFLFTVYSLDAKLGSLEQNAHNSHLV